MIAQLRQQTEYDFYSTSFGATSELVRFWNQSDFHSVRLGSQRDQASGTHSLIMINGNLDWLDEAKSQFADSMHYSLGTIFSQLEIELVRSLTPINDASVVKAGVHQLIERYCLGGSSYDSVAPLLNLWWQSSPQLAYKVSDLFIRLVVQRNSWADCIAEFGMTGRKQAEQVFRQHLSEWVKKSR
jgi:tRNA(Met) cytidine acetyltransferase